MSNEERELREALQAKAAAMIVGRADEPGLLKRLTAARRRRRQVRLAAVAAAVVVALGAASFMGADDPDLNTVVAGPDDSTTTIVEPSTTVDTSSVESAPSLPAPAASTPTSGTSTTAGPGPAPTTGSKPTTTAAPRPPLPADALWPKRHLAMSYPTPESAVDDFARNMLFILTPQVAPAQVTGTQARVVVRALPNASRTTVVTVRRDAHWGWVVVGSTAPSLQVDQPVAGTEIGSPLYVRGQAQAVNGLVTADLYLDPDHSIGRRGAARSGSDEMLPFGITLEFPAAAIREAADPGPMLVLLVVREPMAENDPMQGAAAATVVRLFL